MTVHPRRVEIDLEDLGFDRGGHLLVERALRGLRPGDVVEVHGHDPHLDLHLRVWGRRQGHEVNGRVVVRGSATDGRWKSAVRAGNAEPTDLETKAEASWGLAARGALVESGGPDLAFADLDTKGAVWSEVAPKLYAQALGGQWNPDVDVAWTAPIDHDAEVERVVIQVMTYLIENEQAALLVPARFLGRIHPYFRGAMQLLAVQLADEARHIEVFTRRALLSGGVLGTSSVGGRASLQTLFAEHEFSVASFLLSVLGEGTFLHLLSFLERCAPDAVTARICHLALADEARHVAFGLAHLEEAVAFDPSLRGRLARAVEHRHQELQATAGLNDEVFDALVVLAGGSFEAKAIAHGWQAVEELQGDMALGRQRRLARLGFSDAEARELSRLHTRNFM